MAVTASISDAVQQWRRHIQLGAIGQRPSPTAAPHLGIHSTPIGRLTRKIQWPAQCAGQQPAQQNTYAAAAPAYEP